MANLPKQVLKNTSALAVTQAANLISGFVLAFVLARSLGVTGLGVYTTAMSYYTLAAILCTAGVQGWLVREIARDLSRTNCYMIHAGLVTTAFSLVAALILWFIVSQLSYAPETTTSIYVASLALLPAAWMGVYETVFVAHQRAEFLLYTTLFIMVGRIGVSVYLLLNGYGVVSLFVASLIFTYIAFVIRTYFLVRHIVVPHWEFDRSFALEMLKELRIFTAMGFLASIFANVEILLLSFLQTEAAVGVYTAASKLALVWMVIPWSFMRAIFPLLSQAQITSRQDFHRIVEKSIKYLLALAFPLAVGSVVVADEIIGLVYGSGFEASIPVLRWLAVLLIPIFLNEVFWRVLIARDEQHLGLRAQIAGISSKVGVSFAAVPFISYMGTVLAMVCTQVVFTGMHVFYVQRGGRHVRFFHLAWRFGVAAAVMGILSWLLALRFNLFVVIPAGVIIYGLMIILLRAFSSDDVALLRRLVQRREASSTVPS
jgi:O-antigen/teichoic acid export membrane protein